MKNIIGKFLLPLMALMMVVSCGEEDLVTYQTGGVQDIADAYVQINSQVISFQAGTPSYTLDLDLINGSKKVNKLNIYSTFTDATSGSVSPTILWRTIDIPAGEAKASVVQEVTYADLKEGLTVDGNPLPSDELDLAIGSGWVLSFDGTTDLGTVAIGGKINVAVLSRFAGLYRVIEDAYFRINVASISWTGEERFIGSVDETTFSYNDHWGPFAWGGSSFNFQLDLGTNEITVPILIDGALFSGNRALSCDTEPEQFVDVPCDGSNILIEDPDGHHIIKLTYGYFTDGSGSRQFYEVLEKI